MTQKNHRFTIVAAYDFSDQAALALDRALATARWARQANLHVVAVLEDSRGFGHLRPGQKVDYAEAEKAQEEVRAVVRGKLPELPAGLELYIHARIGDPTGQILAVAAEASADVIVVGTHGRTGLKRWLLGSVAERVVRHAPCAVMVVRPTSHYVPGDDAFAPEPPCPKCVDRRAATGGQTWWCDLHARPFVPPHRYSYDANVSPSDHSNSILW
jgi:nucleotide-binding universal stress UspA family protein